MPIQQDFRRCQSLIQSISASSNGSFPPTKPTKHEQLAAQNVQRGLAAKVQELSATFRKKQRVYMESKYAPTRSLFSLSLLGDSPGFLCNQNGCVNARYVLPVFCFDVDVQRIYRGFLFVFFSLALQGHAIKNQDLLIASGAVTLKGAEGMSDVDEDMQIAVRALRFLTSVASLGVLGVPRQRGAWECSFVLEANVALLFYKYFVSVTSTSTSPSLALNCSTLRASLCGGVHASISPRLLPHCGNSRN